MLESVESRVIAVIAEQMDMAKEQISLTSSLDSLNMDSLDDIEVIMACEADFDIKLPEPEIVGVRSVEQLVNLIKNKLAQGANQKLKEKPLPDSMGAIVRMAQSNPTLTQGICNMFQQALNDESNLLGKKEGAQEPGRFAENLKSLFDEIERRLLPNQNS